MKGYLLSIVTCNSLGFLESCLPIVSDEWWQPVALHLVRVQSQRTAWASCELRIIQRLLVHSHSIHLILHLHLANHAWRIHTWDHLLHRLWAYLPLHLWDLQHHFFLRAWSFLHLVLVEVRMGVTLLHHHLELLIWDTARDWASKRCLKFIFRFIFIRFLFIYNIGFHFRFL